MEKLRKWEQLLILLTAVFLAFLGGYFLGQHQSGAVRKEDSTVSVDLQYPVASPAEAGTAPPSPSEEETPSPSTVPSPDGGLVNINSAGLEELMRLPGIGEALAGRIIAYREANGPFEAKDELMDVSGIGEKKYADCKDLITIDGEDGTA